MFTMYFDSRSWANQGYHDFANSHNGRVIRQYCGCAAVLVSFMALATSTHAQSIQVITENWENPADTFSGVYANNGTTDTSSNTAGAGVGGSRAGVFTLNDTVAGASGGAIIWNVNNPNTTLGDMNFSFDARVTTTQASPGPVLFYAQSFSGVFGTNTGSATTLFNTSSAYQHYSFDMDAMTPFNGDSLMKATDQTILIAWQFESPEYGIGTHTIDVDNISVTAIRSAAMSPEPSSIALLGLFAIGVTGTIARRPRRGRVLPASILHIPSR